MKSVLIRRALSTSQEKAKNPDGGGGIPWMLLVPLGIIGGVVGYFYRGNKNSKNEAAFKNELRGTYFMSQEEMVEVREKNHLSLRVYEQLSQRARSTFASTVDWTTFIDKFCIEQLGGDFQARGQFYQHHIFERLEKRLGRTLDMDLALCALSLTVLADPEALVSTLFSLLRDQDETMSYNQFIHTVELLDKTNQFPVRVLVKTINTYPFNKFERASSEELAEKAVSFLNPDPKKVPREEFLNAAKEKSISQEEFVKLLLSNELCVWGACWQQKKS